MPKYFTILSLIFLLVAGCGNQQEEKKDDLAGVDQSEVVEEQPEAPKLAAYEPGEEGLRKMLDDITAQDSLTRSQLIIQLKPAPADLDSLYNSRHVASLVAYTDEVFSQVPDISRSYEQEQILVYGAGQLEFYRKESVIRKFPDGYGYMWGAINKGRKIWAAEFVEHGEPIGKQYDGFAFVNDRWIWLPQPWKGI